MMPQDWAGRSAFVLAVGLAVGWAGGLLFAAIAGRAPLSDAGAHLLSSLGGAMAGALATYLGATGRQPWGPRTPAQTGAQAVNDPPPSAPPTP
jgi:hypothetical protein